PETLNFPSGYCQPRLRELELAADLFHRLAVRGLQRFLGARPVALRLAGIDLSFPLGHVRQNGHLVVGDLGKARGERESSLRAPGSWTSSASASTTVVSGVTTINFSLPAMKPQSSGLRRRFRDLLGVLARLIDRPDHVEGLLGHVVALARHDLLEALDCIGNFDEAALEPGELRRDEEGLREEPLDLARARDGQLVLFRQLVDSQDRD